MKQCTQDVAGPFTRKKKKMFENVIYLEEKMLSRVEKNKYRFYKTVKGDSSGI